MGEGLSEQFAQEATRVPAHMATHDHRDLSDGLDRLIMARGAGVEEAREDQPLMRPRNSSLPFHRKTDGTPAKFARRARAEAARGDLEQTAGPIADIAKHCAFGDAKRLRRTFRRLYGARESDQLSGPLAINPPRLIAGARPGLLPERTK
jgi:methylphosphotriester-DNA--protein-cysteine methyltransferase